MKTASRTRRRILFIWRSCMYAATFNDPSAIPMTNEKGPPLMAVSTRLLLAPLPHTYTHTHTHTHTNLHNRTLTYARAEEAPRVARESALIAKAQREHTNTHAHIRVAVVADEYDGPAALIECKTSPSRVCLRPN